MAPLAWFQKATRHQHDGCHVAACDRPKRTPGWPQEGPIRSSAGPDV